jgi:hypothetical protein
MSRIIWKEGSVISIDTRRGIYVLAQMSRSPYLIFFNCFSHNNQWDAIDLSQTPILFCKAVTRQFMRATEIYKQPHIKPRVINNLPTRWIHPTHESRRIKVWPDTADQQEFVWIGEGGALVEKDILGHKGGPYAHPSGVFDRIIISSINSSDNATIDQHEIDSIGISPLLNERLYLCYSAGKNVDPDKDILFNRPLPREYSDYVRMLL